MSDQVKLKVKDGSPQISSSEKVAGEETERAEVLSPEVVNAEETSEAAPQQKQGGLKGMLMMAACCAAPLLLLAAIPFLGAAFGSLAAVGSGLITVLALLACPVGMFLMMRMMNKQK